MTQTRIIFNMGYGLVVTFCVQQRKCTCQNANEKIRFNVNVPVAPSLHTKH